MHERRATKDEDDIDKNEQRDTSDEQRLHLDRNDRGFGRHRYSGGTVAPEGV